ncbi:MAG: DMT family transporter, partial [Alistipes sp.]|nr:DMT family transporter [Alistipes sp.]
AINTVLITPVLRRHGTTVVMGWYYMIGTLLAMPMLWRTLPAIAEISFSTLDYIEIGYILTLGSTLPIYMLYVGSEHLTPLHAALYRYLQPILATSLAIWRGQSEIDRTNIVGAVLIFLGMLVVVFATPRNKTPEIITRG